jgi:methionyl-tRNA formyltransferase
VNGGQGRVRLIFAGTPAFAAVALRALIAAGHDIPLVLTQPDRPAGRGMKTRMSAVKEVALSHGLAVAQPENLKSEEARQPIAAAAAEVMVVAAYGLILPQAVLNLPRLGCINIHASLLPRWRGAAPIQRAIEAGDRETGITLMQMDQGLDTGAMLSRAAIPILATDTTASLYDRLAALGAAQIVDLLPRLAAGGVTAMPQDAARATYANKISKAEAHLDWTRPALELDRRIRAFDPFPGAYTQLEGEPFKIWQAVPTGDKGTPGTLLSVAKDHFTVACGAGALHVTEIQKSGGKRQSVATFLAGHALAPGVKLA